MSERLLRSGREIEKLEFVKQTNKRCYMNKKPREVNQSTLSLQNLHLRLNPIMLMRRCNRPVITAIEPEPELEREPELNTAHQQQQAASLLRAKLM